VRPRLCCRFFDQMHSIPQREFTASASAREQSAGVLVHRASREGTFCPAFTRPLRCAANRSIRSASSSRISRTRDCRANKMLLMSGPVSAGITLTLPALRPSCSGLRPETRATRSEHNFKARRLFWILTRKPYLDTRIHKLDAVTPQTTRKEIVMPHFPADLKDGALRQREPTKLECGLLGALSATIVLGVLFWIGVQFSLLKLIIQIN
jgi:hypothetical protein